MPRWEVFDKRATPATPEPMVTIQKDALISFNRAAYEALGEPEAVELLYDRTDKIIGMRPTNKHSKHAYTVRKQGSSSSYLVSGRAFISHYRIDLGNTSRRYEAQMFGNVLGIDLNRESIEVHGRGATARSKVRRMADAESS